MSQPHGHSDQHHPAPGDGHQTDGQHQAGSHRAGGRHQHSDEEFAAMVTQEFWDDRYGSSDAVWSGNPNQRLVEHVSDLSPGTALDVGSGEGADAIWLATHDWQVTGIDISSVALDRAAQLAAAAGREIADRISWHQLDLLAQQTSGDDPIGIARYDLVSAQFMHLPGPQMQAVQRRLAAAVSPGGTLLIVGHDLSDLETSMGRPAFHDAFYAASDIAAGLDPAQWRVLFAGSAEREAIDPEGNPATIRDAILKAVRV